MRQSTKAARVRKPHPDFPLFAHQSGQWAKKVKGKVYYFGVWADPDAALNKWLAEKDDRLAGRVPRSRAPEGANELHDLVNAFLTTKTKLLNSGELSIHSFRDYHATCERLVAALGRNRLLTDILPEDFEKLRDSFAEKWGPVRIGNEINRVRVIFNYGYKNSLLGRPMRYGEGFNRPSRKTLRLARANKGARMFEAAEMRKIIKAATQPMKAMFLLGINCGFGNADVGRLPMGALDLERGWLNYPRPKTGIGRRCFLWKETIAALRAWLKIRPEPKDAADAELVFITSKGGSWSKDTTDNPVSKETRKLLDSLGINGNRNFYAARHSFETIAGDSKDQVAVNAIMGHDDGTMASTYREGISDKRLRDVAEHVHNWLFGKKKSA